MNLLINSYIKAALEKEKKKTDIAGKKLEACLEAIRRGRSELFRLVSNLDIR